MSFINYEERYPTYVPNNQDSHPTHTPNPPIDYSEPHALPATLSPISPPYVYKGGLGAVLPVAETQQPRSILGMTRTVFFLVLALVVLVIGGVVGGAVGGTLAKKNSANSEAMDSGPAFVTSSEGLVTVTVDGTVITTQTLLTSTTSTATASTSSVPTIDSSRQTSYGAFAASAVTDSGPISIHVYYQIAGEIRYRLYPKDGFTTEKTLKLSIKPKSGTPLAATAFLYVNVNLLTLYYLDTSNNIIEVILTSVSTSDSLSISSISTISKAASAGVHASSSLTALYLGASWGYRLFYQDLNGYISELSNGGSGWTGYKKLTAIALDGSPLASAMISSPFMNIFYVDRASESLYSITYGSDWDTPFQITSDKVHTWNGRNVSLAAVAETSPKNKRIYYISDDKGVHEFGLTNGEWGVQPAQSPAWDLASVAAGAIAAVGWDDSVRFYYATMEDDVEFVSEAALEGTHWTFQYFPV